MFTAGKLYDTIIIIITIFLVVNTVLTSQVPTPYGRFYKKGLWGPGMNTKISWMIMESGGLTFIIFYLLNIFLNKNKEIHRNIIDPVRNIFLCMWLFHYLYRSLLYPSIVMNYTNKHKFPIFSSIIGISISCINVLYKCNKCSFKSKI